MQWLGKELPDIAITSPILAEQMEQARAVNIAGSFVPVRIFAILRRLVQRSAEDIQVRIVADFVEEAPRSGSPVEGIIDQVAWLEVLRAELALGVVNHALVHFGGENAPRFECCQVVVKADRFPSATGKSICLKDRKSTRLIQSPMYLVCRLLLEKKNTYEKTCIL